jgi:hypothetical protein
MEFIKAEQEGRKIVAMFNAGQFGLLGQPLAFDRGSAHTSRRVLVGLGKMIWYGL